MKVILLTKINRLGSEGDVVNVKSGFARNFLLPKEKVVLATKDNIRLYEEKKYLLQLKKEKDLLEANDRIKKISALGIIKIYSKSGSQGKLFGSITRNDIVKSISTMGFTIYKNEIKLLKGPLRTLGKHKVIFQPINEKNSIFTVEILSKLEQ